MILILIRYHRTFCYFSEENRLKGFFIDGFLSYFFVYLQSQTITRMVCCISYPQGKVASCLYFRERERESKSEGICLVLWGNKTKNHSLWLESRKKHFVLDKKRFFNRTEKMSKKKSAWKKSCRIKNLIRKCVKEKILGQKIVGEFEIQFMIICPL